MSTGTAGREGGEVEPGRVEDRLGYLLKHANLRFAELTAAALAPHRLDGRELAVLLALAEREPMSQFEVARRLGVDRSSMVALLDELEGRGLVERRRHPDDRRRNVVAVTRAGKAILGPAGRAVRAAERRFFASLNDAEARRFKDALRTIVHGSGDRG